ncbi:hypothetical protein BO99DRAFT_436315 [Aspergillus violaceofuscus CBS 115571]|uniref:Uncharacterized protein n=1 Tax=Aspergillus violaceofuscus (strain CBS 115571) TaxID=1450538 RepID=A0A2V5GVF4_ASPV1|nr:hypothetical protein BO99DRAFT_436315 [Aspergillus violaceofuscus CBS 115571]
MASATGIPQLHPDSIDSREDSPLLSTPGNGPQSDDDNASLYPNLYRGTALAAQVGILLVRTHHIRPLIHRTTPRI